MALATGDDFRFAAFGNVYGHTTSIDTWSANAKAILDWQPNFLINTGNPMEHSPWEFFWDEFYIEPAGDPVSPGCRP